VDSTFVKDVMISDPTMLDASTSIKETAKFMADKGIGCVIVTKQDLPVGIITERDFVRRIAVLNKSLDSKIEDFMSSPLIAIGPDETVWMAAQVMKTNNIHKLPVKKENKIVGIITTTDLVKICSMGSDSEMRKISDQLISIMENQ